MGKKKTVQLSKNDAESLKIKIVNLLYWSDYLAKMSRNDTMRPGIKSVLEYQVKTVRLIDEFNRLFKNLEVDIRRVI